MSNMNNTYYHFLPAVRQGLARWIKEESENKKRAELELNVFLKARNKDSGTFERNDSDIKIPVQLYGPGDVVGFSPKVVVRTEPQIGTYDFEPNYFPFVEFSNSDFVWRYSPHAGESLEIDSEVKYKYIKPWLVLVVLESGTKNDVAEFDSGGTEFAKIRQSVQGLPDLIKIKTESLPNLAHSWRWAHVQINGEEVAENGQLIAILENQSDMVTCRLMCPRRLKPNQKYSCFVLPSTQLGRFAGIDKASLDDKSAYEPAWTSDEDMIEIPFYYKWEFHTGASGDFEHLVRLLEPRQLKDLGTRQIDCSKPGYGTAGVDRSVEVKEKDVHTLDMEGALQSLDTRYTPWGMDPYFEFDESKDIFRVAMSVEPAKNAVRVSWYTSSPGNSLLKYGVSTPTIKLVSSSRTNQHSVLLTGLAINKEYKFGIEFSSTDGPKNVTGRFIIPPDSSFQQDLADLINKPISEDLALEKFNIPIDEPEWVQEFSSKLLPSGSSVELMFGTVFQSTIQIHYGEIITRNGNQVVDDHRLSPVVDNNLAIEHTTKLHGLLPGKSYHITIYTYDSEETPYDLIESSFTMPPLPSVVPPIYGRWHYGKYRIKNNKKYLVDSSYQKNWIDELNLDPRHRSVAGLGTQVIRKNQEDLMASAWDQLGAIESVNDLLRRKQFGRESSKNMLNRMSQLSVEKFVSATIPFQKKVTVADGNNKITVQHYLAHKTLIPKSVLDRSFQKINAHMYKKKGIAYDMGKKSILERFLGDEFTIKQKNIKPSGTMVMDDITNRLLQKSKSLTFSSVAFVLPQTTVASDFLGSVDKKLVSNALDRNPFKTIAGIGSQKANANTIGEAMEKWLNFDYSPAEIPAAENPEEELQSIKAQIVQSLNPEETFLRSTQQVLRVDGILQSKFKEVAGDSLDPIMAAPEFPQPMNESLQELSKSLFLPGIEKIKPNTIGLLETNPRFLEAFMCGLSHEFGSELLWRGYPTDQRGSYFRQFWDTGCHIPTPVEKQHLLNEWLKEHDIELVKELGKEEKEMIIYRHSRLFLMELRRMVYILVSSSKFDGKIVGWKKKDRITNEIISLMKHIDNNFPDAFKDISDDVFEGFDPFITKMVERDCIKESLMDIEPIHQWRNKLGRNAREIEEKLVLIIRGDLLKRYPNAIIYSVDGYRPDEDKSEVTIPALEESIKNYYEKLTDDEALSGYELEEKVAEIVEKHPKIYPTFGAQALPDITFLGFPFDKYASKKTDENPGKYFVIEEHVSEPRFGLDTIPEDGTPPSLGNPPNWDNLSWDHFKIEAGDYVDIVQTKDGTLNITQDKWEQWMNSSSAKRALITLQKPVRIIISANEVLPE